MDLHLDLTDEFERTIRMAKFLGFSTLGLDLEKSYDLKEKVTSICRKEKVKCIFRANVNEFNRSKALKEDVIYIARNVNEARSTNIPFYLLEAGNDIDEVLGVKEFCARRSNINFVIEFDFALLRLYDGFSFANYMKGLTKLMNVCRRRHIVTIFSSRAKNLDELVPPRTLYIFYKILGGYLTRREILYEIPNREIIEKLDLGPKVFGRSE
ncbi:MAG: hypothetical protein H3Z53_12770 [archaeon]|nr:hypothetical protein [archaeon]